MHRSLRRQTPPEVPFSLWRRQVRTLVDQRLPGKKLALITNSDWTYTDTIMRFIVGHGTAASPGGGGGSGRASAREGGRWGEAPGLATWRRLFDVVIVSARKPAFFTGKMPAYEVLPPRFSFYVETIRSLSL